MGSHHKFSRRQFLGTAGCASLSALPFFSSWMSLSKLNAAAGSAMLGSGEEDYRAIVCILLAGGNDSFNMLTPRGTSEYQAYVASRGNLSLPQEQILPLSTTLQTGLDLGIHPSMPEVQQLYKDGKLAFVSNVGTLVEPIAGRNFEEELIKVPVGLFSHSDQIMQWQTSVPQDRSAVGWGGKMADLLSSMNENQAISMNISLSGNNVFQAGNNTIEYSIDANDGGAKTVWGYKGEDFVSQITTEAIDNMLEQEYQNIFKQTYINTIRNSLAANEEFAQALEGGSPLNTQFSQTPFSADLQMIAKTIAVRDTLKMKRQVFFVTFGGWDHHDEVLNIQSSMLEVVSKGLSEFQSAMEELGVSDCVTTFSISDFGRTLTSNGNGSDHGWGGNVFVMGGSVKGGEVYGLYPDLSLRNPLDVGGGVFIPTTSTDDYFAELALWMGVSPNDLNVVLPNIGNFYNASGGQAPIGFLKS